jgi:hypothetical protein
VQVRLNVASAFIGGVTSVPDIALEPDQPPDAEHEVAFVDDQVMVDVPPASTKPGEAPTLTVGAGVEGGDGAAFPSDPPPPQPESSSPMMSGTSNLFMALVGPRR